MTDDSNADVKPKYAVLLAELHEMDRGYAGTMIVAVAADGSHVHAGVWGTSAKICEGEIAEIVACDENPPPAYVQSIIRAFARHVAGIEPMTQVPRGPFTKGGSA